jgi:hypothetical protein
VASVPLRSTAWFIPSSERRVFNKFGQATGHVRRSAKSRACGACQKRYASFAHRVIEEVLDEN